MVDIKSYISDFIKADEIERPTRLFILTEPKLVEGDFGPKLECIVELDNKRRKLSINKSNANNISKVYGTKTEEWCNRAIHADTVKKDVFGEMKDVIILMPETRQKEEAVGESIDQRKERIKKEAAEYGLSMQ